MAEDDDSMDRLEAALERIARRVEQPDPVEAEVAGRLDAVINRLRAGIAAPPLEDSQLAEGEG